MKLSKSSKLWLLGFVRENITRSLVDVEQRFSLDSAPDELDIRAGAFVSLHKNGRLRGCIGTFDSSVSVLTVCENMSIQAAFGDPRFPKMTAEELEGLEIEISVLSSLSPIKPADVVIGVHGLKVSKDGRSGVLLPQVALEWGWNRQEFLDATCQKAGLPRNSWESGGRLEAFSAEVFSESGLRDQ